MTSSLKSDGPKRRPWTPEEDLRLIQYIESHSVGRWTALSKNAGLMRSGKSCRLRWMNHLRPSVKHGQISPDEEDLIIRLHNLLGNRWALISGRVPGRTDNDIKNYWNTRLNKKLAAGQRMKLETREQSQLSGVNKRQLPSSDRINLNEGQIGSNAHQKSGTSESSMLRDASVFLDLDGSNLSAFTKHTHDLLNSEDAAEFHLPEHLIVEPPDSLSNHDQSLARSDFHPSKTFNGTPEPPVECSNTHGNDESRNKADVADQIDYSGILGEMTDKCIQAAGIYEQCLENWSDPGFHLSMNKYEDDRLESVNYIWAPSYEMGESYNCNFWHPNDEYHGNRPASELQKRF